MSKKQFERELISNNIKIMLEEAGLTRTEVADSIGVKYTTFCDWVKGRTAPNMTDLKKVANFFEVNTLDLLKDELLSERNIKIISIIAIIKKITSSKEKIVLNGIDYIKIEEVLKIIGGERNE